LNKRVLRREAGCRHPKRPATNAATFKGLASWFLPDDAIFAGLKFHGNTKWLPRCLVWLALCWALVDTTNLTDAFDAALHTCTNLFSCPSFTYQGFMAALLSWTARFLPLMRQTLHCRMQQINSPSWRLHGWLPIAFDGSRSSAPRTKDNEAAFCAANYGKGQTARYRKKKSKGMRRRKNAQAKTQPPQPQVWITLMWHMGLRLPWAWRLGPSNASERDHVMIMAQDEDFPADTLFCGDAGFVGYPLWAALIDKGHQFLVRVGANVKLLTQQEGFTLHRSAEGEYDVICWPREAIGAGKKPLHLRLVCVQVGQTWMWLLSSVLDGERLTVKAMRDLYQARWGVELEFRGLKQTLDNGGLQSRNGKRVLVELDWAILAMAVVELLAVKEQQERAKKDPVPANPAKRSLAKAVRALRGCLQRPGEVPQAGQDLSSALGVATTDNYVRNSAKKARYRPPNPDKKPLGDPTVRPLKEDEIQKLRKVEAARAS
jgi:hypothetical protein